MEAWSNAEIAALGRRDKRRIWLVELQLPNGTWRAAQALWDLVDTDGRTWSAQGANGEVQGMGTALGRRPREVTITLHGVAKSQSLYRRVRLAAPIGSVGLIYMVWVGDEPERLIVQPKLRFAGVVAARPAVALAETDRATLTLVSGPARASRLTAAWDASPAAHRAYAGADDPIYDRVSAQTQTPQPV